MSLIFDSAGNVPQVATPFAPVISLLPAHDSHSSPAFLPMEEVGQSAVPFLGGTLETPERH